MLESEKMAKIAEYAFMAFMVIALIAGLALGYMAYDKGETAGVSYPIGWGHPDLADSIAYVTLVMLILGVIVGLISVTIKETMPFLIAAIAIAIAAASTSVWAPLVKISPLLSYWALAMLNFVWAFVAPAAVIIAVKTVYAMARGK